VRVGRKSAILATGFSRRTTVMEDRKLRDDVIAELDREPGIDSADIGVASEGGVVTLTGHVATFAQKVLAVQTAQDVPGVLAIAQNIAVRPPQTATQADDEIAKRAVRILAWDTILPKDAIRITVQDGWVTLCGEVDWEFQRRAAEDNVRKLGGVDGVSNFITLRQGTRAAEIEERIRAVPDVRSPEEHATID
jgi:osmotically-inducible protein OsmY